MKKNKQKIRPKCEKSVDKIRLVYYNKDNKTKEKNKQGTVDNQFTSNLNPSKGGTDHQRLNFSFIYNKRNFLYMKPGETNLLKSETLKQ